MNVEYIGVSAKMRAASDLQDIIRVYARSTQCPDLDLAEFESGRDELTEFSLRLEHVPREFTFPLDALSRLGQVVPGAHYTTAPSADNTSIYHYVVFPTAFTRGRVPARYAENTGPTSAPVACGPPSLAITGALALSGMSLLLLFFATGSV